MPFREFQDQVAYIPGGSSGIGLAAARLLVSAGAHVLLFARNREKLESAAEVLESCRQNPRQRLSWMPLDVSRHDMVAEAMGRAVAGFGVPDLLINCAGRAYPRYFEDIPFEQLDETMRINFYGVWNTAAALAPRMKERGRGLIVNVSSVAGFLGVFGLTDYAASKFAVVGFSEALRSELKPHGVRVAVLCPPDTDTPGFAVENRTKPEETRALSATAKLLQPDAVARALLTGIRRGKFLIHANREGRLIELLKRLCPCLVMRIMDRDIRKVRKRLAPTGKAGSRP